MNKSSNTTQVSLARCPDYGSGLNDAIRCAIANLGGMLSLIKPGMNVLIKPNLVSAKEPDRAITTNPEVVRVLVRMVRESGAVPVVGDSPASVYKLEQVWERTGFKAMCEQEQVPLLNFEKEKSEVVEVGGLSFTIARPVLAADAIINVPKLKTHVFTILTNAVKNLYGVIPGFQKTYYHRKYPDVRRFARLLVLLHDKVRPVLSVCDAVTGMEGNGPSGGHPVQLGFIAASTDAFALDTAMCRLLRIRARGVPYLKNRTPAVQWLGDAPESLSLPRFRAPSTLPALLIPHKIMDLIRPWVWIRPSINDGCRFCGLCVAACPVDALSQDKGKKPVFDYSKCIECCCCHEVCPHQAVDMTPSFLMRLASGRSLVPSK